MRTTRVPGPRFSHPQPAAPLPGAFTILELLAAMVVFVLMSILLVSLVGSAQKLTNPTLKQMDINEQVELAFDRIGLDWDAMVVRNDIPCVLATPSVTSGTSYTPFMEFITNVPSSSGSRGLSVVGYCVATDSGPGATGHLCLQRASTGADWSGSNSVIMGVTSSGTSLSASELPSALQISSSSYDLLAAGVIRCDLRFQLTSGSNGVVTSTAPSVNGNADPQQIGGLIVTFVALDNKSLALLSSSQIQSVAQAFVEPASNVLPGNAWNTTAQNAQNFPGIPLAVVQALRVYQRYFPSNEANP